MSSASQPVPEQQPAPEQQTATPVVQPARGRGLGALIAGSVALTLLAGLAIGVSVAVMTHDSSGSAPATLAADGASASASANAAEAAISGPATGCSWTPSRGRTSGQPSPGIPPRKVPASGTRTMTITTNRGVLSLHLDLAKTPCTAASFTHLAAKRYFDNTKCHRLTTDGIYVLQCGDPTGTGAGSPGYAFADEALGTGESMTYKAGTVAMANSGPNTNGSQFFIVYRDSTLAPAYTVLGQLDQGLDLVTAVASAGIDQNRANGPADGAPANETMISSMAISGS